MRKIVSTESYGSHNTYCHKFCIPKAYMIDPSVCVYITCRLQSGSALMLWWLCVCPKVVAL